VILLDTHAIIWAINDDPKLGKRAHAQLAEVNADTPLFVSVISAWEIALLVKRGRLDVGIPADIWLKQAMRHPAWRTVPIDTQIAIESVQLPDGLHSDPADRFIVATARLLDLTLLTADQKILDYSKLGHLSVMDARL
jgi:PIN domain nuclease of toxin-antitoxin system